MSRFALILALLICVAWECEANVQQGVAQSVESSVAQGVAQIRSNYIDYLLSEEIPEQLIADYLSTLDLESGAFSDIDYTCQVASGWKTVEHGTRALNMAKYYYRSGGKFTSFTREELFSALRSVMEYWYREKPKHLNNWYGNMVSCPKRLGETLLLMQGEMSEEELKEAISIVYRFVGYGKNMSGSNLIFIAGNMLVKGLLTGDVEIIMEAVRRVESTIFISTQGENGIQSDYSYLFHGNVQQNGNYGLDTVENLALFCRVLRGTDYRYSDEKQAILSNFVTEGFRWFVWGGYLDMNCATRQYGDGMMRHKGNRVLSAARSVAMTSSDESRAEILDMLQENQPNEENGLVGQKHFYAADGFYHRRPTWSSTLKMHSTRVVGIEQVNHDNLKGYYAADGTLFTYVDGGEYENSAVNWDWRKLPGITCFDLPRDVAVPLPSGEDMRTNTRGNLNDSEFVGAVSDGAKGVAAMILNKGYLYARKSWVMCDDFVLCMGSAISTTEGNCYGSDLTTAVEQKILVGDLTYLDRGVWSTISDGDQRRFRGGKRRRELRLHSGKIGYITLQAEQVVAEVESRVGDWCEISESFAAGSIDSATMMTIYIDHNREKSTSYRYLILPNMSQAEVASFNLDDIELLECSDKLHLVKYDGCYYAVAFEVGSYSDSRLSVEFKVAGIYMFRDGGETFAHDPTQSINDDVMRSNLSVSY